MHRVREAAADEHAVEEVTRALAVRIHRGLHPRTQIAAELAHASVGAKQECGFSVDAYARANDGCDDIDPGNCTDLGDQVLVEPAAVSRHDFRVSAARQPSDVVDRSGERGVDARHHHDRRDAQRQRGDREQ